jgi:hypothetical protein
VTAALDLRPRSPSELVDAGFRLLRRHFGAFVALGTVSYIPSLLVNLAQLTGFDASSTAAVLALVALVVLIVPAYAVAQGALAALAADAYQTGEARLGDALRRALRRVGPAVGVMLLVGVLFAVGILLLIVPGLYLFARLATAFPAVVLEDLGPGEAIGRAWSRSAGRVGHSFGTLALTFLLYFVVLIGATIVGGLGAIVGGQIAVLALTAVITVVVSPMIPIVTTLLCYDLRIRSEGYDLEVLSGQLDAGPLGVGAAGR